MLKAIETKYKGYRFRSRLEARWAVFFDLMGIRYEYEQEGIELSDGTAYLPDFFLLDFNCYFEVKRLGLQGTPEGDEAIRKISDGQWVNEWSGIICFGDPVDDNISIFCQETNDSGGGSYEAPVTFGIAPTSHKPVLFSYEDSRDRQFWDKFGEDMKDIFMVTADVSWPYEKIVNTQVIQARNRARQARFEYGQTPIIKAHRTADWYGSRLIQTYDFTQCCSLKDYVRSQAK